MPSWTPKQEREYEHIKESYEERGRGGERAAEIAARTVNKQRREHGETPQRKTQGTGNPNRPLTERTKVELQNLARSRQIAGRSRMSKAELVRALQH